MMYSWTETCVCFKYLWRKYTCKVALLLEENFPKNPVLACAGLFEEVQFFNFDCLLPFNAPVMGQNSHFCYLAAKATPKLMAT